MKDRINYLDGVRGSAFILVLISHVFGYYFPDSFFNYGKEGVWLFFVLSSFLLSNYFYSNPDKTKKPIEWLNYFFRRFMRIYPLYMFVILVFLSNMYLVESKSDFLKQILLLKGSGHFWTIPLEFKFYFILPIVVLLAVYAFRMNLLLSVVSAIVLIAVHQYFFPEMRSTVPTISLVQFIPVFLIGNIAALIHNKLKNMQLTKGTKIAFDGIGCLIILLILCSNTNVWGHLHSNINEKTFDHRYVEFGLLFSALLIFIVHGAGMLKLLFSSKVIRWFGMISYSGYLIHPILLYNIRAKYPDYNNFVILMIIVIILVFAYGLYLIFEKPVAKLTLLKYKSL